MGNIFNNNRNNLRIKVNYDEYWDFFLNKDNYGYYNFQNGNELYDKCLISYIDLSNQACVQTKNWIESLDNYQWEYHVSTGQTLYNIGFTGVDNGLIQFRKDKISNTDFVKIYSESDFTFDKDDFRLKLHEVSGNTQVYDYPLTYIEESGCTKLNGGFYQGAFETECDKYAILPSKLQYNDEWDFEFVLNKTEFEKESEKTLNDKHPENKGIFFYIGTRAENKWIYLYDKQYIEDKSTDNIIDDSDMPCDPHSLSRFSDLDWYDDLEEWRIEEEIKKHQIDLSDYTDYMYYPQEAYNKKPYEEDDYFDFEDDIFEKPLIFDKSKGITLEDCCQDKWYCNSSKEKQFVVTTQIKCCGCGNCKKYSSITEVEIDVPKCCSDKYLFDEYLSDADEVFEWFGDTEYLENELDTSDFEYETAYDGIKLNDYIRYTRIYTDNKFLLFHRGKEGYKIYNWEDDTTIEYRYRRNTFKGNLFLLMNRTCTGYTVQTIDDYIDQHQEKYNIYEDLYNNALAFRITDSGAIGYRYYSVDCEISGDDKTKIYEGYSFDNIIKENQWHTIHIKLISAIDTMKFKFYVDGKLKYVTQDMPKLNLRKLQEENEKQELVPYNISLGGGTQGLCDVILPNYMETYNYLFPLEKYFGGTFIGYISKFRWYNCKMEYMNIINNFQYEKRFLLKK